MRKALSALLLVCLVVTATTSHDRPDFSGTWILINPSGVPSNTPQTLVVSTSFVRPSLHRTPISPPAVTLTVDTRSGNAVRAGTYNVGTFGGVMGGLPNNGPQTRSHHSSRWERDKLVVDSAQYADGKLTSEHREVWSLDGQGMLTIAITDPIGSEPATTNLFYRRSDIRSRAPSGPP